MALNEMAPVWYLPGPFYQYNEDVKALAKAAGLRIIDANVTTDRSDAAEDVPTVTLKSDGAPVAPVLLPDPPRKSEHMVDIAPGVQVSQAEIETRAIQASGLSVGKFKQLKKAEREAFVVAELEALKAAAAAG